MNRVAERLLGGSGSISPELATLVRAQVDRSTNANTRVADAIYFIAISPEYMLQR